MENKSFKKYVLGLGLCFSVLCLASCKTDPSPAFPVIGYQDLGQPLPDSSSAPLQPPDAEKNSPLVSESAPDEISITISAAGDVTLGNYYEQEFAYSFCQTYDQTQDKGYFFENVADIFAEDDMSIVNLEGPLTHSEDRREGQEFSIKGEPEYVNLLTYGNIEAVSMGNNHRLDYKQQGCDDTVQALKDVGIAYAYNQNVGIYETKGIRIGFVSVNEFTEGYLAEKYLQSGIQKLQEEGVDLILACCHWGVEKDTIPEDAQKNLGRKCIDWGADLVLGHHPHVLQGIDKYQGKYIVYSLGNFCFGANRNPQDKDTMIFRQTFTFIEGKKQEHTQVQVIPCSISSVTNRNDFRPTPAEGTEALRILDRINEYSKEFGLQFDERGYLVEYAD